MAECWSLDPTGNWKKFLEDDNGDGTWDLDQSRTANDVNEITDITETAGPSWVTPAYSKEGNMTTMPQPSAPTSSYTATYDAWNRLVKLVDGANTVAEYEYDAAKRRTIKKSYTGGTLNETRHLFYTEPSKWQVIEERVDSSTDAEQQHIWGLRYIDDIVLRDRDTTANGTLDERLYGMQDANWNATALSSTSGSIQERFAYSAYGTPTFLNPSFVSQTSSSSDWQTLYAGYRFDIPVGLFHVRNRVYHPAIGVWVQRDPLGYVDSMNLYGYGRYSPINTVDPFGEIVGAIIAIVVVLTVVAGIVGGITYYVTDGDTETSIITAGVADVAVLCPLCVLSYGAYLRLSIAGDDNSEFEKGFKICRRKVEPGDCDKVVNACGGQHGYIQYGPVDQDGQPAKGTKGIGWGGTTSKKGSFPKSEKSFNPTVCRDLTKCNSVLQAGKGKDKSGIDATDDEIYDCLENIQARRNFSPYLYNCFTWAREAADACGLC